MSDDDDRPWWEVELANDPVLAALMNGLAEADQTASKEIYLQSLSASAQRKLLNFIGRQIEEMMND